MNDPNAFREFAPAQRSERAGVLVIDDERHSADAIRRTLEDDFEVLVALSAEEASVLLERPGVSEMVDVILCDQRMPGASGIEFLRGVREQWPDIVRIIISGHTDAEDIIAGINEAGIYQYVLKPWMPDQLLETVRDAAEARRLQNDVRRIDLEMRNSPSSLRRRASVRREAARERFGFRGLVRGDSSPLEAVIDVAERVAIYDLPLLVLGESGTGKEVLARAVHEASPRSAQAFVSENCGAIPDTLLESELFGHKRGAFTGAFQDHVGLFQRANGGTLFLDEIGDTSATFQVKLLRVLQEGEVRPVGATRSVSVDVRVIAATHRDLEAEVRAGRFREDLYYRIAGVTLTLPPLRERPGDMVQIAQALLQAASAALGKPQDGFTDQALACLMGYGWPGNIRELRNEIFRALALSPGECVDADALSPRIRHGRVSMDGASPLTANVPDHGPLQIRIDAFEAAILRETLMRHRWNKTRAANELGLSRVGLRSKLQRHSLEPPRR